MFLVTISCKVNIYFLIQKCYCFFTSIGLIKFINVIEFILIMYARKTNFIYTHFCKMLLGAFLSWNQQFCASLFPNCTTSMQVWFNKTNYTTEISIKVHSSIYVLSNLPIVATSLKFMTVKGLSNDVTCLPWNTTFGYNIGLMRKKNGDCELLKYQPDYIYKGAQNPSTYVELRIEHCWTFLEKLVRSDGILIT